MFFAHGLPFASSMALSWMATPPAVVDLFSCWMATPPAAVEFCCCPVLMSLDQSVTFVKKRGGSKLFIDTEMG